MVRVLWKEAGLKMVRDRVMLAACLPLRTRVTSVPGLLPGAMSGSTVLSQSGSVLMVMMLLPPRPRVCSGSGLPSVVILVSEGYATTGDMLI